MIVKNEEAVLERSLKSASPWVDEIIVVDTGSSDSTVAIAEKYGARIGAFEWTDDFSAARNHALKMATGEWIFWIDADDVVPQETGSRLRLITSTTSEKTGCFLFSYITFSSYLTQTSIVRRNLFKAGGYRFEGRVHEQVLPLGAGADLIEVPTSFEIHHRPDEEDAGATHRKDEFYLSILKQEHDQAPDDMTVLFHLAMTHGVLEHDVEVLALAPTLVHDASSLQGEAYAIYMRSLMRLEKYGEAIRIGREGLRLKPEHPAILHLTALSLNASGRSGEAKELLRALAELELERLPEGIDPVLMSYGRYVTLAELLIAEKEYEQASSYILKALRSHPKDRKAFALLADSCEGIGKIEDARAMRAALEEAS